MTRFTASTTATAVVTASREEVWSALTDPALVARLTPFVRRITEDGGQWRWELSGLTVLGIGLAPSFTEQMDYDEPRRIRFRHDPPDDAAERAGVEGWYALEEVEEGTRLETSMEVAVDLPLPRVSGRAAQPAIRAVLDQMGERFSANLLAHLRAEQVG